MTWTLKSGRVIHADLRDLSVRYDGGELRYTHGGAVDSTPDWREFDRDVYIRGSNLTPVERLEIAEAVAAAWMAWAKGE